MLKMLSILVLFVAACAGLVVFSGVVDELPRWVDKVVMLGLFGIVGFAYREDKQQTKRIHALEAKLDRCGISPTIDTSDEG